MGAKPHGVGDRGRARSRAVRAVSVLSKLSLFSDLDGNIRDDIGLEKEC